MISFLVFAVIIFLIGTIFQIHLLFNLAYFFLALHILLKLYHYYLRKSLVLSHELNEDHIFLNEQLECQIRVKNRGRFPVLYLTIEELLPRRLSPTEEKYLTFLKPGEEKNWQIQVRGRRRGFYNIGPLIWEAGDVLSYDKSQGYCSKLPFYVFPRLLSLEELGLPSRLPFGDIKWPQPLYKDPYQMVGIREYQPSDRLNRIHWKATARTGKLQTRESQSTVSLETALVLNLAQKDYDLNSLDRKVELSITAAASLAYYLTRIKQPFSFRSNGIPEGADNHNNDNSGYVSHRAGSGEVHLQKILETLACLTLSDDDNFLELLSGQLELSWGGTIIVITEKDTDELIQTARTMISRGYNIKILLSGERVEHREYLHLSFTAPLSIHQIRREEDIYGLSGV